MIQLSTKDQIQWFYSSIGNCITLDNEKLYTSLALDFISLVLILSTGCFLHITRLCLTQDCTSSSLIIILVSQASQNLTPSMLNN